MCLKPPYLYKLITKTTAKNIYLHKLALFIIILRHLSVFLQLSLPNKPLHFKNWSKPTRTITMSHHILCNAAYYFSTIFSTLQKMIILH